MFKKGLQNIAQLSPSNLGKIIMYNFTDTFIKRPVLAIVIAIAILLAGIVSYFSLPIREYPLVHAPIVSIHLNYAGASPDTMESYIVTPVEKEISNVGSGTIDFITSESGQGYGNIHVHLKLGNENIDSVFAQIANRVAAIRHSLPADMDDPKVGKDQAEPFCMMYLGVQSKQMLPSEITDYILNVIQPQLQVISGIHEVGIEAAKTRAMQLWLDPFAMAGHNITTNDIKTAILAQQMPSATGEMKNRWQEMPINALTGFNTVQQFNDLVIKQENNQIVKLSDIGYAALGAAEENKEVQINREHSVLLNIRANEDGNYLEISANIHKTLDNLSKFFPKDLKTKILKDNADFIKAAISEVQKTLFYSIACVLVIMFLFLGSMRVLLIPLMAIPLSLIGVFAIMAILGYSLNTLTFLALVLAVGMVVDDAIVVVENIYRHIRMGKTTFDAAIDGAREIQFAIISITFTLAAVYAPIGFSSGLTKALFKEFAFTLAAAVMLSGFIALVISPIMCAYVMTPNVLSTRFAQFTHNLIEKITERYLQCLNIVLNHLKSVVIFLLLAIGLCGLIYYILPHELAPKEDMGWILTSFKAPAATNFDFLEKNGGKLNDIFANIPEHNDFAVFYGHDGYNTGTGILTLKPWEERQRDVNAIIKDLNEQFKKIPSLQFFTLNPHILPGAETVRPVTVALQTMGSLQELNNVIKQLQQRLKTNPDFTDIDVGLKIDQPQQDVVIDRAKAGLLGIPMQDINDALNFAFGRPVPIYFTTEGRKYDVIPQLDLKYNSLDALNNLQLKTTDGTLVSLANLVTLKESVRPREIDHFQQLRSANLEANIVPGYALGDALKYIETEAKKIMPSDMKLDYYGQARQFMQASSKMPMVFSLAIIFIFLLLAVQFESFRDPLIVMLTVPFSILGALLILLIQHNAINIYTEIGMITLVGLITKHGILMVVFANQERTKGETIKEAIVQAAKNRLRPILMTTLAIIIGAVPLAYAQGAGSISRHQLGWVIITGMAVGTLFTLFVIPVMYILLTKRDIKPNKKNSSNEL